jgi:hypothetical protein
MDLTILAYATLGLSLFVSAVKMGGWILHADPRAILNAGRWSLIAFAALALGLLVWLVTTGRWAAAMMLAAFMLPVFVQAAPRWRVLFGPLSGMRSGQPTSTRDFAPGFTSHDVAPLQAAADPELVRQSVAVLQAYLGQSGLQIEHQAGDPHVTARAAKRSGNGRARVSMDEALDILGLDPTATAEDIREAHRRLEHRLDPECGGTHYLAAKINEARDVLLGE